MAKVNYQEIPPSLIAGYRDVMSSPAVYSGAMKTVGLAPTTRAAKPIKTGTRFLILVGATSQWLTDQWQPDNSSLFYAARRAELLGNHFDPAYWYNVNAVADRTEYGTPVIGVYDKLINPAYADPLRQASKCVFKNWSKTYNTPLGNGTANEPAPGWKGSVIDMLWRDLWFAQRRLSFNLPVPVHAQDTRPLLIEIDSQVQALATVRGNASWFAVCVWPFFYNQWGPVVQPVNYLITLWQRENARPLLLPEMDTGGWAYVNSVHTLRSGRTCGSFLSSSDCNKAWVLVTTPPSRGVYFARNDNVLVTHHETVTLHIGKGPNG